VAVLGDLHIGRPGSPLSFQGDPTALAATVEALLADVAVVVVNGDLLDLDRGPLPWSQRRELAWLRRHVRPLLTAFQHPRVLWLAGNHDAQAVKGADAVEVAFPGGPVRIEHGHRFDAPIKRWPPFTRLVTWASGRAVYPPWRPVYDAMRGVEARLTGEGREGGVEARALRWLDAQEGRCHGLVLGHTHRAGFWQTGTGWLLNPGASPGLPLQVVRLDGVEGRVRREAWKGGSMEAGVWQAVGAGACIEGASG
jgi:predicted phosphodiesterase